MKLGDLLSKLLNVALFRSDEATPDSPVGMDRSNGRLRLQELAKQGSGSPSHRDVGAWVIRKWIPSPSTPSLKPWLGWGRERWPSLGFCSFY